MLDRMIHQCGMCQRRYFYYRRSVVILRKKECDPCRYRKTCPYFEVRIRRGGLDPECSRKARLLGLKKF